MRSFIPSTSLVVIMLLSDNMYVCLPPLFFVSFTVCVIVFVPSDCSVIVMTVIDSSITAAGHRLIAANKAFCDFIRSYIRLVPVIMIMIPSAQPVSINRSVARIYLQYGSICMYFSKYSFTSYLNVRFIVSITVLS